MKKTATLEQIKRLKNRSKIERIFAYLKGKWQLVTSLPRSPLGYFRHYCYSILSFMFNKMSKSEPASAY